MKEEINKIIKRSQAEDKYTLLKWKTIQKDGFPTQSLNSNYQSVVCLCVTIYNKIFLLFRDKNEGKNGLYPWRTMNKQKIFADREILKYAEIDTEIYL